MTGIEYSDRLINDIAKSATIRAKVHDPFKQVKLVGLAGQANLQDFLSALNVWDADAHLDILSQFININERLVEHNKGAKVDISIFGRDISKNRAAIGEVFQQILGNNNLIDLATGRPIATFLKEQLDLIHRAAN